MAIVTCPCGVMFEWEPAGRGRPRTKCDACRDRRRAYTKKSPRSTTCVECGTEFPAVGAARYCSPQCKHRAAYVKRRRKPCYVCGEPTGWAGTDKRAPGAVKHNDCVAHGTAAGYQGGCRCRPCTDAKTDWMRDYWERNPDRKPGKWITQGERQAIYERDGWRCQLCGEDVDPGLSFPHPMSATLDHIECQSWALVPDHSAENLRLAHFLCNQKRGNREWKELAGSD